MNDSRWVPRPLPSIASDFRLDPYFIWAKNTEGVDLGGLPPEWWPVIMELQEPQTAQDLATKPNPSLMQVHPLYTSTLATFKTRYCTALVSDKFFDQVAAGKSVGLAGQTLEVARFDLALPIVTESLVCGDAGTKSTDFQAAVGSDVSENDVVVAIIDDGFAFAHERFRGGDGKTRVVHFWDQGYYCRQNKPYYGREHVKDDIEGYLSEALSGSGNAPLSTRLIDEEDVYRRADYDGVRRRIAHGTHVADLACGSAPEHVDERAPKIVFVQLQRPSRRTRDRFAGWLAARVLDGLRFIAQRAPKSATVINMSFGNIAGPHDGSSILECAMDELIRVRREEGPPFDIVIAAGNSNLSRCHARFTLYGNASKDLTWRILPDDPTPNFLEIWLPPSTSIGRNVTVRVCTPTGDTSEAVNRGEQCVWQLDGTALCSIIYLDRVSTGARDMVLVAVSPTTSIDRRYHAPSGDWRIVLQNDSQNSLEIDAWIQRDETPFDFPRHGRQSRFEDPEYERFDAFGRLASDDELEATGYIERSDKRYVWRRGTINSIASGKEVTVIGGCRRSDGAVVRYSSSGPMVQGSLEGEPRRGPDASAVSDDSTVLHGVLAAGARSGSVVAMDGTSVATALITRRLAESVSPSPFGSEPALPEPPPSKSPRAPAAGSDVSGRVKVKEWALAAEHESGGAPVTIQFAARRTRTSTGSTQTATTTERPPEERSGHGRIREKPLSRIARRDLA